MATAVGVWGQQLVLRPGAKGGRTQAFCVCGDCSVCVSDSGGFWLNCLAFSAVVHPGRGPQRKAALETGVAHAHARCFKPREGAGWGPMTACTPDR